MMGKELEITPNFPDAKLPRNVPRTDTGGQGEYPKVSERTMVKELGKMTP